MEIKELKLILDKVTVNNKKIPNAYHSFKASGITNIPDLPYIIYFVDSIDTVGADNKVKYKENRYIIELYTTNKSVVIEEVLEKVLDDNNIFYEKFESYIDAENMYQIAYQI